MTAPVDDEWVARYSLSHQHPVNKACHLVGIPMIILSLLLVPTVFFWHGLWPVVLGLFVVGWALQFIGHVAEGKPPEFLRDWRFLLVGLRWWLSKFRGNRE